MFFIMERIKSLIGGNWRKTSVALLRTQRLSILGSMTWGILLLHVWYKPALISTRFLSFWDTRIYLLLRGMLIVIRSRSEAVWKSSIATILRQWKKKRIGRGQGNCLTSWFKRRRMVPPARIELATPGLGNRLSRDRKGLKILKNPYMPAVSGYFLISYV